MYIAMNRFRVRRGEEEAFESVWRNRNTRLRDVEGFVDFHLLRGPEADDHTVYASHTMWKTYEAFSNWTKSQAFRDAHKNAGENAHMYLGSPQFEGFSVVLHDE